VAAMPSLVVIGILCTSLFCTLGSIIGAANILQAIAKDELLKALNLFAYGRSSDNGPTTAIVFTWILIQSLILFVKDIDEMASFVTMFSLLTFGIMNLACFLLRITGSVNFRPSFK
jgi:potassium/chloride transporter 9